MTQIISTREDAFPDLTTAQAFSFYQSVRHRLPQADFPDRSEFAGNLDELADKFDVFVFDAYGVLNKGTDAVPGAAERISALQEAGKKTFVLTNGASLTAPKARQKFQGLQMPFQLDEIVPSRLAAERALLAHTEVSHWGLISEFPVAEDELPVRFSKLSENPDLYDAVDGFLFLSAVGYTPDKFGYLRKTMMKKARPLIVANPDVVAPQSGFFSLEPGFFSHTLADELGITPEFHGKPFRSVFEIVMERLPESIDPSRIAMMGDTLHTDILGAAALGWKTVLVTDHGLFAGEDAGAYIRQSGIVPDFIIPTI